MGGVRLSSTTSRASRSNTIGTRIRALTLYDDNVHHEVITAKTGVTKSSVWKLRSKVISRGWMPGQNSIVEPHHVDDAPRSGRPKTSTVVAELIIKTMTKNSTTRGWSTARIAYEVNKTLGIQTVSRSTVYRVLKEYRYSVFKRIVKPGLTVEQMKARLDWCLAHKDWTLKD
jgi:transposase